LSYTSRGAAYDYLGERQRAIEDYDKAIRLDPRLAIAYFNRGVAYKTLGQRQRAIETVMADQATLHQIANYKGT